MAARSLAVYLKYMPHKVIYIENDNLLQLNGLKNEATGAYVNDAVVTGRLKDETGADVSGQSWPVTLQYVAASNGNYRVTLEETLSLVVGKKYVAEVTAVGNGLNAKFKTQFIAVERR